MILHKREEKLSCASYSASEDGALNNIQDGLPSLPIVGQNLKGYLKKHPYERSSSPVLVKGKNLKKKSKGYFFYSVNNNKGVRKIVPPYYFGGKCSPGKYSEAGVYFTCSPILVKDNSVAKQARGVGLKSKNTRVSKGKEMPPSLSFFRTGRSVKKKSSWGLRSKKGRSKKGSVGSSKEGSVGSSKKGSVGSSEKGSVGSSNCLLLPTDPCLAKGETFASQPQELFFLPLDLAKQDRGPRSTLLPVLTKRGPRSTLLPVLPQRGPRSTLLPKMTKDSKKGCVARKDSNYLRTGRKHSLRLKEEQFFLSNSSKTKKKELFKTPFQLRSLVGSSSSSYQTSYDFRIAFKNRLIPREYSLETFHRSNQDTCLLHNPAVFEGDWVQSGDLLADCAASSGGELSLGKNILIAYMPWEGYNFEDAILISERLVFEDVYSSIHIERYDIEIRETKYGMETITRNIPELNEKELEHLDSNGVAKLGSWIQEGDVLVGRVTPINKKVQSTYKNLLFTILQTKPESVRDSSLRAPRGMKGKIVNVQRFSQLLPSPCEATSSYVQEGVLPALIGKDSTSFTQTGQGVASSPETQKKSTFSNDLREELGYGPSSDGAPINIVYVYLAEKRKIQVGDKMAGRHGNKGIVSQVLPRQDMPFLSNGTPLDMVLNPLGVPSRMNVGQIYECLLGLAAKYLGEHYKIFPFDEKYGPEASRSFVYSKLYEARKKTGSEWLFNPNCPGKTRLFDGRTGDPFDQSVTVGYAYMLKLVHLVDDKIHMRSTGPYSLVTQQPLRGRSKQGGQRLGEMEVWALEGYGAAFTLLEMLTIKSDDMTGRMTLWSNLILNKDLSIGTPESFKVLVCELQALCLDIGIFRVDSVGNLAEIESLTELP